MLGLDVCEFGGQVLELLWLTVCYRGLMSDKETVSFDEEDDERHLNYKPPSQKSLQEIRNMDKHDDSLIKYKQTLLGAWPLVTDSFGPNVQVTRLTLLCNEAPQPITMDLTGDREALKEKSFSLKEGAEYRMKIHFKVKKEIVAGLKYMHMTTRRGVKVEKVVYMVGSYGPREEEHEFVTPLDEAPKGIVARGRYQIKSRFVDDDYNTHLCWEWNIDITKDWNE